MSRKNNKTRIRLAFCIALLSLFLVFGCGGGADGGDDGDDVSPIGGQNVELNWNQGNWNETNWK